MTSLIERVSSKSVYIALNSFLPMTIPILGFWTQMKSFTLATLFLLFVMGPEEFLNGESFGRAPGELDDYRYFYINMYSISFYE